MAKLGRTRRIAGAFLVGTMGMVLAGQVAWAAGTSGKAATPCNPRVSLGADAAKLATEPYASGSGAGGEGSTGGRTESRLLYGFENGLDGQPIGNPKNENMNVITVLDYGVTEGEKCARLTAPKGGGYSELHIAGGQLKNWAGFDYLAIDLFTEDAHAYGLQFELWDGATRNYHTRCTLGATTRKGHQTIMWHIGQAKRNGKEGRTWEELEPQDKINLNTLRVAKIFLNTRGDRPAVFWVDNIRLLQADAAKPKMQLPLPGAVTAAFDFGTLGAVVPGFNGVGHDTRYPGAKGYGFEGNVKLLVGGAGWPDLLAGTFVSAEDSGIMIFKAKVPNGDYIVWLCAGPVITPDVKNLQYVLKVNDKELTKETATPEQYDGEDYIYRFMWTQYSDRPHALWLDYVSKMYPVRHVKVSVTDGHITLKTRNHFVSGMVILPAKEVADYKRMSAKFQKIRIEAFDKATPRPAQKKPTKLDGDGDYVLYVPLSGRGVGSTTGPNEAERKQTKLVAAGAPGQNVIMRVAVVPFEDLGVCRLELSDLKGRSGTIPASSMEGHFANWRYSSRWIGEMVLLPTLSLYMEKGLTQCYWLWLRVPDDAKAGSYTGSFTFHAGTKGTTTRVPVEFEVYPFKLERNLPAALGMYYNGRHAPNPAGEAGNEVMKAQMRWMSRLGFTSVQLPNAAGVSGVDVGAGKVTMWFNKDVFAWAKEAGLAQCPEQTLMIQQLGIARWIGRRLPGSQGAKIDQQPGIELKQPQFKGLWFDAMRQYKGFLDSIKVPYSMEIIDEPREVPNPWNRNLADTITYGKWMGELGINRFITPMGDSNGNRDYTVLADHADVVSVHANPGSKGLQAKAREQGKVLWYYNAGMSRDSWGFYSWARGATGRFEWHWSWVEGWVKAHGDYLGREWYNPFTPMAGTAPNAPVTAERPGGFLYSSAFLGAADGITDYAYLCTLERAIAKHRKAGTKQAEAAEANRLLETIRTDSKAGKKPADQWRAQIAEQLKKLI